MKFLVTFTGTAEFEADSKGQIERILDYQIASVLPMVNWQWEIKPTPEPSAQRTKNPDSAPVIQP